ncbi:MAG: glycosyltransferase family 2 protein [Bryobacteraceae bacterium]
MKLLIAIPAYNEEEAIEKIIVRSLEARDYIKANSPVTEVDVTVVSDGSVDGTAAIAGRYADRIRLIAYQPNRGYGAAIKTGWAGSDADLLGFLDADGTCDPKFFAPLCARLERDKADVILGCRLNPGSKMPLIRRIGNTIFALILSAFSSARVRDTASGMRVIRRASLPKLMPLPDGLHFTPAMSARAMLAKGVKICEIDMPYHEREGESKLRVGKDGLRFLRVILETAFLYRPPRPLWLLAAMCLAAAAGLMIMPAAYYLQNRSVVEWMIYRFVVSHLAGTSALLFFCAGQLGGRVVGLTLEDGAGRGKLGAFFTWRYFWLVPLALMAAGGWLVMPSLVELIRTGSTYEHWSRFIAMSFLFSAAVILIVTAALNYFLDLVGAQLAYVRGQS